MREFKMSSSGAVFGRCGRQIINDATRTTDLSYWPMLKAKGRTIRILVALSALSLPAIASDWGRYGNARFQYWIDIPPGFSEIRESENGDGGISLSSDRASQLSVWGGHLTDRKFAAEIKGRADQDRVDGWSITYQKQKAEWAVWSGAKGDRIFYERAILTCDGAAAYFRLEYDKEKARVFDPLVSRLAGSLRSESCRRSEGFIRLRSEARPAA
jgi:hypothetical protein